jgi:hypothetical protein
VQKGYAWKGLHLKRGQAWKPSCLLSWWFLSFLILLLLLIYMTSGSVCDFHFFLVTFIIFFTLCSIKGLAALAVQCKRKQPRSNHVIGFDHGVHLLWTSPAKKALVCNLSAFTTLFVPDKSWDNVRSSAVPYTESRSTHSVWNECAGFPVVIL